MNSLFYLPGLFQVNEAAHTIAHFTIEFATRMCVNGTWDELDDVLSTIICNV